MRIILILALLALISACARSQRQPGLKQQPNPVAGATSVYQTWSIDGSRAPKLKVRHE
jgi:hypothetical protein